jgi:hypothetical protein
MRFEPNVRLRLYNGREVWARAGEVIGRASRAHVMIRHGRVSEIHAHLSIREGAWHVMAARGRVYEVADEARPRQCDRLRLEVGSRFSLDADGKVWLEVKSLPRLPADPRLVLHDKDSPSLSSKHEVYGDGVSLLSDGTWSMGDRPDAILWAVSEAGYATIRFEDTSWVAVAGETIATPLGEVTVVSSSEATEIGGPRMQRLRSRGSSMVEAEVPGGWLPLGRMQSAILRALREDGGRSKALRLGATVWKDFEKRDASIVERLRSARRLVPGETDLKAIERTMRVAQLEAERDKLVSDICTRLSKAGSRLATDSTFGGALGAERAKLYGVNVPWVELADHVMFEDSPQEGASRASRNPSTDSRQ